MTTRREYAAGLGLAIAGARGRLSLEATKACNEAEANGTVFTSTAPVVAKKVPKPIRVKSVKTVKVTSVPSDDDLEEYNVADRTHPRDSHWRSVSGQILNEAAVCSPCGVSLGWHVCTHPQAVVSPGVTEYVKLIR